VRKLGLVERRANVRFETVSVNHFFTKM